MVRIVGIQKVLRKYEVLEEGGEWEGGKRGKEKDLVPRPALPHRTFCHGGKVLHLCCQIQ